MYSVSVVQLQVEQLFSACVAAHRQHGHTGLSCVFILLVTERCITVMVELAISPLSSSLLCVLRLFWVQTQNFDPLGRGSMVILRSPLSLALPSVCHISFLLWVFACDLVSKVCPCELWVGGVVVILTIFVF